ncbi:MAG: hypothetical protein JXA30_08260 [Deltaproteobacteria bacterium]|nr:hypothetical protein [Deltaproteobacteria bacterium]
MTSLQPSNRAKRRFQRLMLIVLGSALLSGFLAFRANAFFERSLIGFGESAMRYPNAANQTKPVRLLLNGATVMLDNGASDASVDEVLDFYQAKCRQLTPNLEGGPGAIKPSETATGDSERARLWEGIYRIQTKSQGVVACLDLGTESISIRDLAARVRAFLATGDLSAIGDLRYTMVKKGRHQTVFVNLWTEGIVNIKRMFPRSGDAPGKDFPGFERPAKLRRRLSLFHEDSPSLNLYTTTALSTAELKEFYERHLTRSGWTLSPGSNPRDQSSWIGRRDNQQLNLSFVTSSGESVVVVALQNNEPVGEG